MQNKWLEANAIGWQKNKCFCVCSKHFVESDFKYDYLDRSENSLISKKEVYHLFHPRQECVDIVSRCERKLKSMSKKDFVKKNSFEYVRLQIVFSQKIKISFRE